MSEYIDNALSCIGESADYAEDEPARAAIYVAQGQVFALLAIVEALKTLTDVCRERR